MSSEHWTFVFTKNEAVANCLHLKMTIGKLSSLKNDHWQIVFT